MLSKGSSGLFISAVFMCLLGISASVNAAQIDVDASRRYQTITAWGAVTPWDNTVPDYLVDVITDMAANDICLNRLRFESGASGNKANARRWEWENDDDNPFNYNWSAYNLEDFDLKVTKYVLPFKNAVEARGEPFSMYVSNSFYDNGSSGEAPAWLLWSPGENAEFATSMLLRLKDFGIEPDSYVILNEAGYNNDWTTSVVTRMIYALGPRLAGLGLNTGIQYPEALNPLVCRNTLNGTADDERIWRYINLISYHLYGAGQYRPEIKAFAQARGLQTAQTEYLHFKVNTIYDDMILGGTSIFEVYGQGFPRANLAETAVTYTDRYWDVRQVARYVRPGAVRIEGACADTTMNVLAFDNAGAVTVVIMNNLSGSTTQTVDLTGLPAGQYGVSQTLWGSDFTHRGLHTVDASGALSISAARGAVVTVFPYIQPNYAPEITSCAANNDFLKLGQSSSATFAVTAQDTELDSLSYQWEYIDGPAGADVQITSAQSASTNITGMTAVGLYKFEATVSDGDLSASRAAFIKVFDGNQPPVLNDVHNRKPVLVTLPVDYTLLRSSAQDIEGDAVTYQWSIVSQPAGADAQFEAATNHDTNVTNMLVPGDYVFRITASDGMDESHQDLTVPVYPVNENAPVISSYSGTVQPSGRATLSAVTSDPDGDEYTRWWELVAAPDGSNVHFTSQGSDRTEVSADMDGYYHFRMVVADRTKYAVTRNLPLLLSAAQPRKLGDLDGDGNVNFFDFIIFKAYYKIGTTFEEGDFNGDGQVNISDFLIFKNNYGK